MDAQALLQPKDGDAPSGENMEYDPVFTEMELAAQHGQEQQIGDAINEASGPDYSEVRKKAMQVLEQSHDLRAAVFLAEANLPVSGFVGFAEVTAFIRGCLEQHWTTCHPQLDEDDDDDPTMRINTLQGLCGQPAEISGPSSLYRALRRTGLTESRAFGKFSIRDIEIAEGTVAAPENMETVPDTASVAAAFQDTDEETLTATLNAATQARDDVQAISAVFDEHTPGRGPELAPLIKLLGQVVGKLGEFVSAPVSEEDDAAEGEPAAAGAPAARAPAASGTIASRTDVTAALDRIMTYYQNYEPSSPIPLLLARAKRLVNADFMTIMADMAPGGVDNVKLIKGEDGNES